MTITAIRNLNFINAKDYQAQGDGSTDDYAAIQAALNACGSGGTVRLPNGIFRTSAPLIIPPNVTLLGSHGKRVTKSTGIAVQSTVKPLASFSGVACIKLLDKEEGSYSDDNNGQRIKNLTLDGSALSGSIDGIKATGLVHDVQLENVAINRFSHNGLTTTSYTRLDASNPHPYSWTLINCIAFECDNNGFSFNGCTDTELISVEALGSGVYGMFLANMANSHLVSCRAEWSGDKGYYITGSWGTGTGSGGLVMSACSTDRNKKDGVYIDATGSGQIIISSMMCRRDGRNSGSGGGGYAGFTVNGATMPVIVDSIVNYPGVDDDGAGTNSPQIGFQSTNATYVSVANGYLHANTTPWQDGGGNTTLVRGPNVTGATGSTSSPVRATNPYTTLVKSGLAKISGGATQWGIPSNMGFLNVGTSALVVNEVRYVPMRVDYPVTLTAWELEVSTGPASAANLRLGIYAADTNLQPVGAPLYDSGSVAVAQSFTGIKTASSLSIALSPGMYLVALNCDVAMTVRTFTSPSPMIAAALGATPMIQRVSASLTFGAYPNPGTVWTATNASASGLQNFAVWQWTE
jgi:hypothetical protein